MSKISATFPAGSYWIGDLCYVMHPEWKEMCNLFFAGRTDNGCNEGKFTLADGRSVFAGNTAWGDGFYQDNEGRGYGVDAGVLGIIAVSDISEKERENNLDGGHVIEFHQEFTVSVELGSFNFGGICIETGYDDEEEEENYWENEDDWDCDPMDEREIM